MQPLVLTIYTSVLNKTDLPYHYPITDSDCIKHMPTILRDLQALLPQCSVKHALMARGSDGQLYDIAELNDETLQLVDKALDESYIVVY